MVEVRLWLLIFVIFSMSKKRDVFKALSVGSEKNFNRQVLSFSLFYLLIVISFFFVFGQHGTPMLLCENLSRLALLAHMFNGKSFVFLG